MIDIVYVLGTGSKWSNNELRYSLRSVEKYLTGYRNIYIIGECPEWLTGVLHVPMKDERPGNLVYKERNIMLKVLEACRQRELSKEFLFMNDDHFFLSGFNAGTYPNFFLENLPTAIKARGIKDQYCASMQNTLHALHKTKLYDLFFDVHYPIRYNKEKFMRVMDAYDWQLPYGYIIKSLYANTAGLEGTPVEQDCKINGPGGCEQIQGTIDPWPMFSTGNNMDYEELETVMEFLYPDPSRYEK